MYARSVRSAFSLIEVVIAVAVLSVLMLGVMEATAGTTSLSEDVTIRADLRQQAQHICVDLSEALFDADILQWNIDADGGTPDTGFNFVEYRETLEIFPSLVQSPPEQMSLATVQAQYPRVADNYVEERNELSLIPDDVPGLDKNNLPGFFVIISESLDLVFIGVTMRISIRGTDYTESYMVFNKFNGDLTPRP